MAAKYILVQPTGGNECFSHHNSYTKKNLIVIDFCTQSNQHINGNDELVNIFLPERSFTQFNCNAYILECVLNHIFDSILPSLTDLRSRQVMLELWSLVPDDIAESVRESKDFWSKESTISSFQRAEFRQNGFAKRTLEMLINSQKDETIRNLLIDYIETNFQGHIILSETADQLPNVCVNQFGSRCLSSKSLSNLKKCVIPAEVAHAQNTRVHRNKFNIAISKTCAVMILAGIILSVFSCYCTYLILNQNINSLEAVITDKTDEDTGLISPIEAIQVQPSYNITVSSYKQYNDTMSRLPYDKEVYLTINITRESDWPTDIAFGNTNAITTLECDLPGQKLLNVLENMRNIKKLILVGTKFSCKTPKNIQTFNRKIELPSLKDISFNEFKECSEFYKLISKTLTIRNVNVFTISGGVITSINLPWIQALLQNARDSVSSLELPGTVWMSSLFNSNLGTLEHVSLLRVDFIESSKPGIVFINRYVDNLLPNLRVFISGAGYIPWIQFLNMSDCKKIEEIKVGVTIPKEQETVNIFILLAIFPSLKTLDISIKFEGVENRESCVINGIKELERMLEDFSYQSNCYDKYEYDRINKLLEAATDSEEIEYPL